MRPELLARRRLRIAALASIQARVELIALPHVLGNSILDEFLSVGQQLVIEIRMLSQKGFLHRLRHWRTLGTCLLLVRELEAATYQRFFRRGERGRRRTATDEADGNE
jgi:hypothetical protein